MANILSILLYLLYKSAEAFLGYKALTFFGMRYDMLILAFYGGLSGFQFLFLLFQSLPRNKKNVESGAIFQYTTILIILMDIVILGFTGYYLFQLENDKFNILFSGMILTPLFALFYLLHSIVFSSIIKKHKIVINNISLLPNLFFILMQFGIPIGYIIFKTLTERNSGPRLVPLDILSVSAVLAFNAFIIFLILVSKAFKAKRIGLNIKNYSMTLPRDSFPIDDPNEFGYIQTGLSNFAKKIVKEKENLTLMNDYISRNLRGEIAKFGVNMTGEAKTASVVAIKYSIPETSSVEDFFKINNQVIKIVGAYADEYDAYPLFYPHLIYLAFGVPFYYEHQKYNALESTQKIIGDLEKLMAEGNFKINIHVGIHNGGVMTGALNTKGSSLKEYTIMGSAMEIAERIASAAENVKAKILACDVTFQELKYKFHSEKSFKIKLKDGSDIIVHQISA